HSLPTQTRVMTTHTLPAVFTARRCAWRVPALSIAFIVSSLAARAQANSPAPADPVKHPADSEIVSLSEFTVSAGAQTGYVSSETMTGSRLPTKIKDLPYNVEVITSEFLEDFNITDPGDMVNGGVVTLDQDAGNSYLVRGISATGQ